MKYYSRPNKYAELNPTTKTSPPSIKIAAKQHIPRRSKPPRSGFASHRQPQHPAPSWGFVFSGTLGSPELQYSRSPVPRIPLQRWLLVVVHNDKFSSGADILPKQSRGPPLNGRYAHPMFCMASSSQRSGRNWWASSPYMSFRRCNAYTQ